MCGILSTGGNSRDICIKDSKAFGVCFFRITAHQLQSQADTQNRLFQGYNCIIKPSCPSDIALQNWLLQHRERSLYQHSFNSVGIICYDTFETQTCKCILDRFDISCIIFENCDHNLPFVVGRLKLSVCFTAIFTAFAKALNIASIL